MIDYSTWDVKLKIEASDQLCCNVTHRKQYNVIVFVARRLEHEMPSC